MNFKTILSLHETNNLCAIENRYLDILFVFTTWQLIFESPANNIKHEKTFFPNIKGRKFYICFYKSHIKNWGNLSFTKRKLGTLRSDDGERLRRRS